MGEDKYSELTDEELDTHIHELLRRYKALMWDVIHGEVDDMQASLDEVKELAEQFWIALGVLRERGGAYWDYNYENIWNAYERGESVIL